MQESRTNTGRKLTLLMCVFSSLSSASNTLSFPEQSIFSFTSCSRCWWSCRPSDIRPKFISCTKRHGGLQQLGTKPQNLTVNPHSSRTKSQNLTVNPTPLGTKPPNLAVNPHLLVTNPQTLPVNQHPSWLNPLHNRDPQSLTANPHSSKLNPMSHF